ncbi:hypothetical protein AB0E04_17330 [Streptomyces sp. NPDC048251]|uniref:hypothetical protein n=1 Tax=Streptomyces sp. NPDC048251 TaxID=3154501 RepID=UPI00342F989E
MNQERDNREWSEGHLSGRCQAKPSEESSELLPEQRFNELKGRLITATGSPGLTSLHDGRVLMTLGDWERLISRVEAADAVSAAQTAEMHARELHHFEEEQISASVLAVLDEIRRLCDGVEYKVPGKHETWDAHHKGKPVFAGEIEALIDRHGQSLEAAFFQARIGEAVNRADDDVSALEPEDEQVRDAANLIYSAALHYLEIAARPCARRSRPATTRTSRTSSAGSRTDPTR